MGGEDANREKGMGVNNGDKGGEDGERVDEDGRGNVGKVNISPCSLGPSSFLYSASTGSDKQVMMYNGSAQGREFKMITDNEDSPCDKLSDVW